MGDVAQEERYNDVQCMVGVGWNEIKEDTVTCSFRKELLGMNGVQ